MGRLISLNHRLELKNKGYTVIDNLLTNEEADKYRGMYSDWVASFTGDWPKSNKSLIQRYKVGHMEPTWAIRLKAKRVFQEVWGTEKLLTSFDAIAIGRPPEDGEEDFHTPGRHWLHVDQTPEREGLHAYQGAVYLETTDEDDWAFEVIEGSHEYHDCYLKGSGSIEFFTKTCGLKRTRVPVGKGGIVLWDSRLVHANARPIRGRKNPGRWRYAVFVCMTPAKWADEKALRLKKKAYKDLRMTCHWPSNGIDLFPEDITPYAPKDPNPLTKHPPSAKTTEAKQLAGVLPYESSEDSDVMAPPKWRKEFMGPSESHSLSYLDAAFSDRFFRRRIRTLSFIVVGFAIAIYILLYYL